MSHKSKFVVFLLSVVPGLSHFYLGAFNRGVIFLAAAVANTFIALALAGISNSDGPLVLLLGLPVIWLVALVDSIVLTDRVNMQYAGHSSDAGQPGAGSSFGSAQVHEQNKKILTCVLSIVPGAGHMYLGYQTQGLELMTLFFFSLYLIDWIRISLFMFVIPVIWFYSMFDALGKAGGDSGGAHIEDRPLFLALITDQGAGFNGSRLLGYGLIGIGLLLIFGRIISPLISYQVRTYLQTGVISLLFIYGGFRLLSGGRKTKAANKTAGMEEKTCADGE